MSDDEIMWFLVRMEQQMLATEFVGLLQRYHRVLYPTLSRHGWWRTPKDDELWLESFRKARDRWWRGKYVPPAEQDEVVLGELPDGTGFIGRRSHYRDVVKQMRTGRTLQTLENVRSSGLGALGWFAYGDAGSDIGANLGRGLGAVATVGRMRSQYKDLSQVPAERTTSGYVAPLRRGTGEDTGTGSTGVSNRLSAPPKPAAPPQGVRPAVPASQGTGGDVRSTQSKAIGGPVVGAPAKPAPNEAAAGRPQPSSAKPTSGNQAPTAAAVAAGVPRPLAVKLRSLRIDTDDAYTMRRIAQIADLNKTPEGYLLQARAGSGEMRALVREGRGTGVRSVRFLAPSGRKGDRTPDIEVTMQDGTKRFVEVRTITEAGRKTPVKDAAKVRTPLPEGFEASVEAKIRHGQISETNPGKIVFHAPFQKITSASLEGWRDMLKTMVGRQPFPKGLQRIEVTGGTGESILIFQPPDWRGVIVK